MLAMAFPYCNSVRNICEAGDHNSTEMNIPQSLDDSTDTV